MLIFSVYMQNNAISCQLEPELKNVQAELEKCQMHLIQNANHVDIGGRIFFMEQGSRPEALFDFGIL